MKEGAVSGTMFVTSENGWINQALYLEWFRQFLQWIPPVRPVLLIQDGRTRSRHTRKYGVSFAFLGCSDTVHITTTKLSDDFAWLMHDSHPRLVSVVNLHWFGY